MYVPKRGQFKGQQFKTEYQYKKHRLQTLYNVSSPKQYTKYRKSKSYQRDYTRYQKKKKGTYQDFFKGFVRNRQHNDPNRLITVEDQQMALKDYLVLIGNREEDDPWEVGETPKVNAA